MKTVFVNPERCIGCQQCQFACAVEHSQGKDPTFAWLEDPVPRTRIHVQAGPAPGTSFPNRCRHCDPAPCLAVCPTAAIRRDDVNDLVLIDREACIACAMCALVCPFDVLTFYPLPDGVEPRITAVKCDGCADRVSRGEQPACVEACKTDALVFGELNELLAQARIGEAAVVLAASAHAATEAPLPDSVARWRAYGEQLVEVDEAAASPERGETR